MITSPTNLSTYRWCFVVLSLWLVGGLFSSGVAQEVSTNQPLQIITNTSQFARLTGEEARKGFPVHLEGLVVSIDSIKGEVLIKDAAGTVPVKVDLTKYPLCPGQAVLLDGKTSANMVRYPDFPSGHHYLTSFEAPQNVADHYASRLRGYLHPPQTGEYTFWIASDDDSELWLSPDANTNQAKKIASVSFYSLSREWDKFPSQRSVKILLKNNQTYYIEAVHHEIIFADCLAVAWEGPGIPRTVIEGRFLSPWAENQGATGTILREFWLNYSTTTMADLNWVNFVPPCIVVSGLQSLRNQTLKKPRRLSLQQPLSAEEDYQWVECEGLVVNTSWNGQQSILELADQKHRMSLHVADSPPDKILGLVNARVRVRGFCQGAFTPRGERVADILWVPSLEDISLLEPQEDDWSRLPTLPLHQLMDTNSPLRAGQRVRLQGSAVVRNLGRDLTLRGVSQFTAFVSPDGTNWTQVGKPIMIPMNQSIYAGLAVESYNPGNCCTATLDHVSGLSGPWTNTDIGNPPLAGRLSFDGNTYKIRGSGNQSGDMPNAVDQLHFLYQPMAGDGELVTRVVSVEGHEWDNAGVMMRETLNADSKVVTLAVPVDRKAFVLRLRRGTANPNENFYSLGLFRPSWLKLVRQSPDRLIVHSEQSVPVAPDQLVEAMGVLQRTNETWVLNQAFYRVLKKESVSPAMPPSSSDESKLTTAQQIRQLSAEELLKSRTATLRGTVTSKEDDLYVQDGTAGIRLPSLYSQNFDQCRAGQYVEVTGLCMPGDYSPVLVPNENGHVTVLGAGRMPEAELKTWGQLMSGKEEAQWVEVRGVVRSVEGRNLKLQMPGGVVSCLLGFDYSVDYIRRLVDGTVNLQGVCKVLANEKRQLVGVQLLLPTAEQVTIVEPALEDSFARQSYLSSELLKFDSQKELFHRVKVEGVVTCQRGKTLFLQDVTGGMTVEGGNESLRRGDRVEAVGFVGSGGFSPVLTEALVRKIGQGELPTPVRLPMDKLLQGQNDAQRVRLEAVLLAQKIEDGNQVLEFLSERRSFRSLLATKQGIVTSVPSGSRVALVGVFKTERGGLSQSGERVSSFQVLLDSPDDVVILERPPWWTWKYTLTIIGIMLIGLLGTMAWVRTLRRKVEERTRQLAKEMQLREASEHQRILEGERSRIARDLHDALGATLTQIRFISIRGSRSLEISEKIRSQMVRISKKSLEMVSTLDEIVWAVNPANDSLKNLVTYLCLMAEEFFSSTSIRCRLDVDEKLPSAPLTAEVRHNIYLAVREVFNNIAKHSHATEVWLRIHEHDGGILFAIEDNGCGLLLLERTNRSGLTNIRARLEKINGKVEFETQMDAGTVCRLWLPLNRGVGSLTTTPSA